MICTHPDLYYVRTEVVGYDIAEWESGVVSIDSSTGETIDAELGELVCPNCDYVKGVALHELRWGEP